MNRIFIVAPSYNVAEYYLRKIERSKKDASVLTSRFDSDRIRGLRSLPIIVLNKDCCDEELIEFLNAVSNVANLKLEYINV